MKKIIAILALVPSLAFGQITNVFIGSAPNDGTGDTLPIAFTKINYNFAYFMGVLSLNSNNLPTIKTNQAWMLTSVTNLNTLSAILITNYGYGNRIAGNNLQPGSVNSNALDVTTLTWLNNIGWNQSLNGAKIAAGTVNSNALDADTMTWLNGLGGGGGGLTDLQITNVETLPAGSAAYATNTGVAGGIAYYILGVPKGDGNTNNYVTTNTVTVQQFTNTWIGSRQFITFQTNNAFWGASNYLARVNGFYKGFLGLGNDGGNPPSNIPGALLGSYNGTNGWFVISAGFGNTNSFTTTNYITIVETNAPGVVQPGGATCYTLDHWELLNHTNYGFGQHYRFDQPVDGSDAATKSYADGLFANAFNNNWSSYNSNGLFHFVYSYQNTTVFDITSQTTWLPVTSGSMDGTGTNFLMTTYLTNITSAYTVQSSTNLALVAGFTLFTNYTVATNTGVVTFTIPINIAEDMRFFRIITGSSSTASVYVPLSMPATIYPSNSWTASYNATTNVLKSGDWAFGLNSNGVSVWKLWNSNGVFRAYLQ